MLRRTRRRTADTVWFCAACPHVSTADDRAERRYTGHRHSVLATLGVLRRLHREPPIARRRP